MEDGIEQYTSILIRMEEDKKKKTQPKTNLFKKLI